MNAFATSLPLSLAWPSAFTAAGRALVAAPAPRLRANDDAREHGAYRVHLVQAFHVATSPKENPGCNRGVFADLLKTSGVSEIFLNSEVSEMTAKTMETTAKQPEGAAEYGRAKSIAKVQRLVRALAAPVEPGEGVGAQILKAYRRLSRAGVDLKFSRVKSFWHADARNHPRDWEVASVERVASMWALRAGIARNTEAAGGAVHETETHANRIASRTAGASGHQLDGAEDRQGRSSGVRVVRTDG